MKKLVLLFILIYLSYSQTVKAQEPEIDFSAVNELRERDRKVLDQILQANSQRYSRLEREALKVQVADILASPTYTGHISKGAALVNLATEEQELLNEDIYVIVYSKADKSGYHYLQNERGQAVYKTLAKNISNISQVTSLYEPPLFYEPVVKKEATGRLDKHLVFSTELNFHLGLTRPYFVRDLVNDQSNHTGEATRYELQTYGAFSIPFTIGLSAMFENQTATLNSQGENYSTRALSLGPVLKTKPFSLFEQPIIATLGARASVFATISETRTSESLEYRLAQTSLFMGLQRNIKIMFGEVILGANFQRQWSKASSDTFNTDLDANSRYDDSFALSIGHKTDWL